MKEDNYLSKEYTNCVRGICAIIIVVHHLYQYTGLFAGTHIGNLLQLSGALAVSVFFFYSGYGLMLSSAKQNYIQSFFRSRFLPLYCFYVILVILYSFWTLWIEHKISLDLFLQSFFFGNTLVTNGWYLQATFVLYLIYLFSFSTFNATKTRILVITVAVFLYCILCRHMNLGIWWYQTIPCAVLGMIYCNRKPQIDILLKKYVWIIFIVSCVSAVFFKIAFESFNAPVFIVIFFLFFVCAVITFSHILCGTPIINNSFFALCGNYSLEIYVSHGFFLRLIRLNIINNKFTYILTVIIGTIILSTFFKKVYQRCSLTLKKFVSHP